MQEQAIEFIKDFLPFVTLIATGIAVVGLVAVAHWLVTKKKNPIISFVEQRAVLLSAIVAITATTGSLFYSDIAGYTPCKLCWLERIFMYPQAILLTAAHLWQDRTILRYSILLTVPGLLLAGYHYLLQIGVFVTTTCSTVGFSLSCSDRFFLTYGYITIPMMCLVAFALLLLAAIVGLRSQVKE